MDTAIRKIAIVEQVGEDYEIRTVTLMTEDQLTATITEVETLRQENQALRQNQAYHLDVTMQNNADLRAMFDVLNRTGILRQNEIHITAFLKNHVRKIIDDYDYDRTLLGRLAEFNTEWKDIVVRFFKNGVLKYILKRMTKK